MRYAAGRSNFLEPTTYVRQLTPKEKTFAREYVLDLNATAAARRTNCRHPDLSGFRLLRRKRVAAEVRRLLALKFQLLDLTAERVLEELRRVAFADPLALFDAAGNLKPMSAMTEEERASIASVEVVKRNLTSGDGAVETLYRVKRWDKNKALEVLAKYFGLLIDRVVVTDDDEILRRLAAGRERARLAVIDAEPVRALLAGTVHEPDNLSGQPRTDHPDRPDGQHPPFRGCPSGVRSATADEEHDGRDEPRTAE